MSLEGWDSKSEDRRVQAAWSRGAWPLAHVAMTSKPMGSHFKIGAPPIIVYFSGDWDVHWTYGVLIHGQVAGLGGSDVNS